LEKTKKMGRIFNVKTLLWLFIIVGAGYLCSEFPDEAILIGGVSLVLVIGIWLMQIEKESG